MNVTPHFTLAEFGRPRRVRNGKVFEAAEYPLDWVPTRLVPLCLILEKLREQLKAPIKIGSGYRDPAYNAAIGGARASQHMAGRAADITVKGVSAAKVHATVLRLYNEKKLPALGGLGQYPGFIHVDVRPTNRLVRWGGSRKEN